MNAAVWERAKALLAEAADLPAAQRERFVTERCADPELRREVLEMLASPAPLSEIITSGALAPGDRLGPYVIDRLLGRGGMGVVYRARDARLDRTVAIKVLPPEWSTDPARRERFDREAHAIAALDDPHICTLYDIGRDDGVDFLIMQYLEGETLASRLTRGRLPLDDALGLAIDIVGALDRAHRAGIVHRDLKPANIMVTKVGAVLLDFGLARLRPAPMSSGASIAATTPPVTAEGTLIGTLSYMAPEHLEGRDADVSSDVWAFGCVLYEMLTGTRAFDGESQARLISAIMSGTPAGLAERVPAAPPSIDRLVRTCLAKNPDDRFQSSHDVLMTLLCLRDADTRPAPHITDATRRSGRRSLIGAAVAVIVATTAALGYLAVRPTPPPDASSAVRFDLQPPSGWRFQGAPAISPDGRHVVANASNDKGAEQLWLRTLDEEDGRFLPGTEKAGNPFWAPDSRAIAFFVDGKLKRLDIRNLSTMTICDAPNPRGGAWTSDDQIVFAPGFSSGLVRVPAAGGVPVPLTSLATDRGEFSHRFPVQLSNRRLTYHVMNRNGDENGTWLVSLDDPHQARRLVHAFDRGIVVEDRLFWTTTGGALLTQRLDSSTGRLLGDPATVVTGVSPGGVQGLSAFSISSAGALVFQGRRPPATQLAWVARNGRMLESVSDVGFNLDPQLSPDGGRVAYVRFEQGRSDLWVVDVERHSPLRILSEQTRFPIRGLVWSRDGSRIAYTSDGPGGNPNPYLISAAGGQSVPFLQQPMGLFFSGWTPDGQTAIWMEQADMSRVTGQVGGRFAIKTMGPDRKPVTYFDPGYGIQHVTISPDGRWIAFSSDQSGRRDVFIIGYPEPGTPQQVSPTGGTQPRWRADGRELFFLSADSKLMAVSVNTVHGEVTFGRPERLFDAPMHWWLDWPSTKYDVSPDGTRFLVDMVREEPTAPLTVILNWPKLIQRH
jgi:serine/threonine protein kinase/Tol biopolymer transport system component